MTRRGATGLSGVLVIDKPSGCTSHDVVAQLRRATGEGRIGHAGTLDPLATGVLVVLVGSATRLEPYLSAADKTYRARVSFGKATDTLDAEGAVTATAPVPDDVLDRACAEQLLARFIGPIVQTPPAYSAIKRGGVPSYRAARAGRPQEPAPRQVHIRSIILESIDVEACAWEIAISVSKGTYVRSLARDIGQAAGTVAHLAALRRTASGAASLEDAASLPDILASAASGDLPSLFVDPLALLPFPVIHGDPLRVRSGRALPAASCPDTQTDLVAVLVEDRLGAVYRREGEMLVPETVFVPEVSR